MNALWSLVISLCSVLGGTISSSIKPALEMSIEETVIFQKQKISELEGRISSLENRETADLIQRVKDELLVAIQDAEKRSLDEKNRLLAKIEELEKDSSDKRDEFSVRLQAIEQLTVEQKDDILKSVTEVKKRCEESTADFEGKLLHAENRFTIVDSHLLMEVLQLKTVSSEAIEKVRSVEHKVMTELEKEGVKTEILMLNMKGIEDTFSSFAESQLQTNVVIQNNASSLTDEMILQLNDSIVLGLEKIQSNFTAKLRFFENSLLKFKNDCANTSHVAKLNERLQNLGTTLRNEFESFQSEFSPRVKQLEERCVVCDDIQVIRATLANHTSQISSLDIKLFEVQNSCSDPPSIENGYSLISNRSYPDKNHGAIVSYACRGDRTLAGGSEIKCLNGEWTGVLPACMSSCHMKDLRYLHGLDIPEDLVIEHSKTLDSVPCQRGYAFASTSESITCYNGTWRVKENPCVEDHSQCGLGYNTVGSSGRLVRGNESAAPWPWMAALYIKKGNNVPPRYSFECGGSVIHRHFILTSAYCVHDGSKRLREGNEIKIKLGLTDLRNETNLQEFEVQKVYTHPSYRRIISKDYDIALLELEKPVEYSSLVKPVCLPPKEIPDDSRLYKPQSTGWTIGWGYTKKKGEASWRSPAESLKETEFIIQPRDVCAESFTVNSTDRTFCASEGDYYVCKGDDGGPAMQWQVNEQGRTIWTQVGTVSYGLTCGPPNKYILYTHLQKLMPWVDATIKASLK